MWKLWDRLMKPCSQQWVPGMMSRGKDHTHATSYEHKSSVDQSSITNAILAPSLPHIKILLTPPAILSIIFFRHCGMSKPVKQVQNHDGSSSILIIYEKDCLVSYENIQPNIQYLIIKVICVDVMGWGGVEISVNSKSQYQQGVRHSSKDKLPSYRLLGNGTDVVQHTWHVMGQVVLDKKRQNCWGPMPWWRSPPID